MICLSNYIFTSFLSATCNSIHRFVRKNYFNRIFTHLLVNIIAFLSIHILSLCKVFLLCKNQKYLNIGSIKKYLKYLKNVRKLKEIWAKPFKFTFNLYSNSIV